MPPSTRRSSTHASSRSPLTGRPFGDRLIIGELIGRGGMSRVYRGWVRETGAEVAIKVLRDDLASRPDAVRRFVRERDLLGAVASPHVVRVHDLVVHGDELGIVMDLVSGGHLRRAVTYPCRLDDAAGLAAQIADGLAAVHAAGVVHRDLKPENVLVETTPTGDVRLRLTDFGISRLIDSATLTQTSVTGTPGYLAPEVAAGHPVTAAADVYALGVMLYELCTGRQPFLASNPLLLVLAHTRQEPPRPLGMPDPLWQLLSAALAKDPAARPAAAAIARSLRGVAPQLAGLPACTVPDLAPVQSSDPTRPPVAPPTLLAPAPSLPPAPPVPPARPRHTGTLALGAVEPVPSGRRRAAPPPAAGGGSTRTAVLVGGGVGLALAAVVVTVLALSSSPGHDPLLVPATPTPHTATGPVPVVISTGATPPGAGPGHHVGVAPPRHGHGATPSPTGAGSPTHPTSPSPSPSDTAGLAPPAPAVARSVTTDEDRHASDGHATLALGGVQPGGGTLTGITVRYSPAGGGAGSQDVPVADGTDYTTTVSGLTNGVAYTFTVQVCNSLARCTTSAPFRFTPYGAPEVAAPRLVAKGLSLTVTARPETRHANPGTSTCTVTVIGTPADPLAPTDHAVASTGGAVTFTGRPLTSYVATETCTTAGVSDGSASSPVILTGAGA